MIDETISKPDPAPRLSYEQAADLVGAEVHRLLTTAPGPVRGYTAHLAGSRGKMIRTHTLLSCAEDREGKLHPNAVQFASAIEILHLATLVHDDIIDNADTRRGAATLQRRFGKRNAVICGDYLFCLALSQAGAVPNRGDYLEISLSDYAGRICMGELLQGQNSGNVNLSIPAYLRIISGKTAALFELSAYAGALLCADTPGELRRYMRLGHYLGMIFQLTDDCIDFEAPGDLAQKPVQSDYEHGVITLPLIHAFHREEALRSRAQKEHLPREELNRAVRKAGGLSFTKSVASRYYAKAIALLDSLDASEAKRERLTAILDRALGGLGQKS